MERIQVPLLSLLTKYIYEVFWHTNSFSTMIFIFIYLFINDL